MDLTAAVRKQFTAAARHYVTSNVHRGGPDLDALVAAAGSRPGMRLLDVGCGTGHTTIALAAGGGEVIGLDLTEEMLAHAREEAERRGVDVRFEFGRAEELPFPDASLDVVTSRVCAHHYRDAALSVREAFRVLRPGGLHLVIDTVVPESPLVDTFLNAIELVRDPSHVRNYRRSEWKAMFADAGFDVSVAGEFGYDLDFEDWTRRMHTPPVATDLLRHLLGGAPEEVRTALSIVPGGYDFRIPAALVRGVRPA
jgi:ubiquinone/menaquinone biosynthesis C-methylase UbiE